MKATSHILCRAVSPKIYIMCFSHMIYTMRQCLIHTCNAVPMPCPCRAPTIPLGKRLFGATAQHRSGTEMHVLINICSLSAAFGRPAQIRLLPAITRILTKVFNQNATAFLDVLTCSDDDDDDDEDSRLYRIMHFYELTLKLRVQTVFLLLF